MKKHSLILAVLVTLAVPAGASAHKAAGQPTTNPVALAYQLASSHWGEAPCDGKVHIVSAPEPASVLAQLQPNESASAWSTWETPVGPDTEVSPYIYPYTNCVVTLNDAMWINWLLDDDNFLELCDLMTHELGHLWGHGDEGQTNLESIEYSIVSHASANYWSVPQCQGKVLWYGGRRIQVPEV